MHLSFGYPTRSAVEGMPARPGDLSNRLECYTPRVLLRKIGLYVMGFLLLAAPASGQPLDSAACEKLASLNLAHASFKAELIAAGAFKPPQQMDGAPTPPQGYAALPAFCRLTSSLTPTSDSDIRVEVWLPAENWN